MVLMPSCPDMSSVCKGENTVNISHRDVIAKGASLALITSAFRSLPTKPYSAKKKDDPVKTLK